jgi:hypothetical protein
VKIGGYAAIFDHVDRGGDVVRPGAFDRTLRLRSAGAVPLLWQHAMARPIGGIDALAVDGRGLHMRGTLRDPVAAMLVRAGKITGLSFGYRPRKVRMGEAWRQLIELDLVEISIVMDPMQPQARVAPINGGAPDALQVRHADHDRAGLAGGGAPLGDDEDLIEAVAHEAFALPRVHAPGAFGRESEIILDRLAADHDPAFRRAAAAHVAKRHVHVNVIALRKNERRCHGAALPPLEIRNVEEGRIGSISTADDLVLHAEFKVPKSSPIQLQAQRWHGRIVRRDAQHAQIAGDYAHERFQSRTEVVGPLVERNSGLEVIGRGVGASCRPQGHRNGSLDVDPTFVRALDVDIDPFDAAMVDRSGECLHRTGGRRRGRATAAPQQDLDRISDVLDEAAENSAVVKELVSDLEKRGQRRKEAAAANIVDGQVTGHAALTAIDGKGLTNAGENLAGIEGGHRLPTSDFDFEKWIAHESMLAHPALGGKP